jgi:nucleotide-binding universal stress UspA family protein
VALKDAFRGRGRFGPAELADLTAGEPEGRRNIVVVVDRNESSLRAAAYAVGLAQRQGLRLVVLYVHTLGPFVSTTDGVLAMRAASTGAASSLRVEMARQATAVGVEIAVLEREGDAYAETMRLAGRLRVEAVVLAGGRNFGQQLFGSPVSRLVRDAQCPVTVVP